MLRAVAGDVLSPATATWRVQGLGQHPSGDGQRATEHQKYAKAPTNSPDESEMRFRSSAALTMKAS